MIRAMYFTTVHFETTYFSFLKKRKRGMNNILHTFQFFMTTFYIDLRNRQKSSHNCYSLWHCIPKIYRLALCLISKNIIVLIKHR